jgi:hypothetical protein
MRELDPDMRQAFVTEIGATMTEPPTCEEIAAGPERWAPIPKEATGDARQRAALAIGDAVAASCAAWPDAVRQCTRERADAPRACLDSDVPANVGPDLDAALARRAEVWKRAAKFKSKDRKIKCKKVADAHYERDAWIGKMADASGSDRRRAMRKSEDALEDACKDEKWPSFVRGCVIAARSEEERGWCIDIEKRWAYPALGAVKPPKPPKPPKPGTATSTGLPACDAYLAAHDKYIQCSEITAGERAAAQSERDALAAAWQDEACRTATEKLDTRIAAAGCDL